MNNSNIRILHIAPKMLSGGGIENTIMNYYRSIDRSQIQFDFLVHSNDETDFDREITRLGGRIYRATHYHDNLLKNIVETFRILNKNKEYKIIHIHTSSGIKLLDGLIARICGKKHVIFHSHSCFPKKKLVYKLTTPIFRFIGTDFLACSNQAGKFFFGNNITKNNRFKVIKNAIDLDKYIFDINKREKVRKELGIDGKFVIGHTGRFTSEKNHKFILEIFKEVLKINDNAVLILIGEGILKVNIKELAKTLEIEDKIIFTGVREDVNELLQAMDIFLFPSEYEGLGMALIEAQASGLICITSENVLRETNLTGNVKYLDLKKSCKDWAMEILYYEKNLKRIDEYQQINDSGYNLKTESRILENYYLNLYNER